jgi:UDP-2,4-diacetamido-2,4,6-trideoxy-beta-L-altropyranose hydrolase
MRVAIRADASAQIGTGHVIRSLTLADALRSRGATVSFICRLLPGHLCDYLQSRGYVTTQLPQEPLSYQDEAAETIARIGRQKLDWLIVDHYDLDRRWESEMRRHADRVMVIDDLADRGHDCELLLDQNFFTDAGTRYRPHVPGDSLQLLGPRFALLRPQFAAARAKLRKRDGSVQRALVYFGGSDPSGETARALRALQKVGPTLGVDVIVGPHNAEKGAIERIVKESRGWRYFSYVEEMAELMSEADLFIGTAGSATWERCCLGLPSLVITNADNQVEPIANLAANGVLLHAGHADQLTERQLGDVIAELIAAPARLKSFSSKSMRLVDGKGAERCADHLAPQALQ